MENYEIKMSEDEQNKLWNVYLFEDNKLVQSSILTYEEYSKHIKAGASNEQLLDNLKKSILRNLK